MARVVFTHALQRHVACPPREVAARTVRDALDAVFADLPRLRGYVLDDQGELRADMAVFVDGVQVADRKGLRDPIGEHAEIYVLQALSGG